MKGFFLQVYSMYRNPLFIFIKCSVQLVLNCGSELLNAMRMVSVAFSTGAQLVLTDGQNVLN